MPKLTPIKQKKELTTELTEFTEEKIKFLISIYMENYP